MASSSRGGGSSSSSERLRFGEFVILHRLKPTVHLLFGRSTRHSDGDAQHSPPLRRVASNVADRLLNTNLCAHTFIKEDAPMVVAAAIAVTVFI